MIFLVKKPQHSQKMFKWSNFPKNLIASNKFNLSKIKKINPVESAKAKLQNKFK